MSAPGPAFQFYYADFLASTAGWTPAEVGAYLRLLCYQWEHSQIPANKERCRRIAGASGKEWPELWELLQPKFPDFRNPRMTRIIIERTQFQRSKVEAGKAGAAKRWGHVNNSDKNCGTPNRSAIDSPLANGMANDSSPSPTPTLSLTPSQTPEGEGANAPTPAKKAKAKRGSRRCPPAYQLTTEIEVWAKAKFPQVDLLTEFDKFKDHEFATVKRDWDACLRNWIRKADDMRPQVNGGGFISDQQYLDALED